MALLSQRKVSLFNESLIKLMEMLMADHWNRRDMDDEEKPQQQQPGDEKESWLDQ